MDYEELLEKRKEEGYRKFLQALVPEGLPVLGVRMKGVREVVREASDSDPLSGIGDDRWYEVRLARLLGIAKVKQSEEKRIDMISEALAFIDSWALCDSFVSSLKNTKKERERYFAFISNLSDSPHPYTRRFILVMILAYFTDEFFMDRSLSLIDRVRSDEYTVQMAKAWAITTLLSKDPEPVISWYRKASAGEEVHRMLKQKIRDSTVVDSQVVSRLM